MSVLEIWKLLPWVCICGLEGSGFAVQGSGLMVQGSGFRVQGSGFRVQGSGFRVQGSGFRVQGSGCMVIVLGVGFGVRGLRGGAPIMKSGWDASSIKERKSAPVIDPMIWQMR